MDKSKWSRIQRFIPFMILALMVFIAYWKGGFDLLNFEKLRQFEGSLIEAVMTRPVYSMFIFICVYMCVAISTVPGLLALDLIAGYLFGHILSIFCVLSGALLGALSLFLATRYAFGDRLLRNKTKVVAKIKDGFDRNQASYLLFLRIVPFVPFGLANIALGVLDVSIARFIWTTVVGMFPVALTFTQAGGGLGKVLQVTDPITLGDFMNRQLIFSLVGVGVLTLLPIFFRKKRVKE